MTRRTIQGTVVSTSMEKTAIVRVDSVKIHPKYHKRYKVSKKYYVHNEEGKVKVGETVSFKEARPMSKNKRWTLVSPDKTNQ